MVPPAFPFWAASVPELLCELQSRPEGLTGAEALGRLKTWGANRLRARPRTSDLGLLLSQFKSPIILILLLAAWLSLFPGERRDLPQLREDGIDNLFETPAYPVSTFKLYRLVASAGSRFLHRASSSSLP